MAQYIGDSKDTVRASQLIRKRQQEQDDIIMRKKKIQEDLAIGNINNKFSAHFDAVEQQLRSNTVGLVTLDQMRAKQEDVIKAREKQIALNKGKARLEEEECNMKSAKGQMASSSKLSFVDCEEEDDDSEASDLGDEKMCKKGNELVVNKTLMKNPNVDTSFLPDRQREEKENSLREMLRQEWVDKQEKIKGEEIKITYSYWDGSGHRRDVILKKGNSIQHLLQRCLETLRKEFNELRTAGVDQLMYIKEDLIIPHHYTFYDFIVTKARGKSGPLFNFDVHEDVRLISDSRIEKDESHAGKICLRSWYERNKHIFPASRWEPYDPEKVWDKYTVSDKNDSSSIQII